MSDEPQLPEVPLPPATGQTPLRTPMSLQRVRSPDPLVLVIFGGTGDLARRKLMPALWKLKEDGLLPDEFCIVGNSREEIDDGEYRKRMRGALEEFSDAPDAGKWAAFEKHIFYIHGSTDDPRTFTTLRDRNLELLRHAGPEGLRRVGVHEERGEESVGHIQQPDDPFGRAKAAGRADFAARVKPDRHRYFDDVVIGGQSYR